MKQTIIQMRKGVEVFVESRRTTRKVIDIITQYSHQHVAFLQHVLNTTKELFQRKIDTFIKKYVHFQLQKFQKINANKYSITNDNKA
jgi:hypothetical protein